MIGLVWPISHPIRPYVTPPKWFWHPGLVCCLMENRILTINLEGQYSYSIRSREFLIYDVLDLRRFTIMSPRSYVWICKERLPLFRRGRQLCLCVIDTVSGVEPPPFFSCCRCVHCEVKSLMFSTKTGLNVKHGLHHICYKQDITVYVGHL